jgi:hypothetical protein
MPSGKQSRKRRQTQVPAPPPVRAKGGRPAAAGAWLSGRNLWWLGGGALVVAVIVLAIALTGGSAKPFDVNFAQMSGLQTDPPPWNNGVGELQDRLGQVHLDALAQEQLAFHIHMHLDIYVNGKHVTVPAGIGISTFITEMHVHAPDGVLHVESAKNRPYTLGQLFGEWSVRLMANCLGRYCGQLHWWVNGKPQAGNPADLVVHAHQEIVIAAGTPPAHIPAGYNFPAGE